MCRMSAGPAHKFLLVVLLLNSLAGLSLSDAQAESEQEIKTRQLEQLRQRITALKQELISSRSQYSDVVKQLAQTETEIGQRVRELRKLKRELSAQNRKLDKLQREQKQLQQALATQRELLAEQIRAAYVIGRQEYLKLLLNQENPAAVGRMVTYYDYFNRARGEHIETALATMARLDKVEAGIRQQHAQLSALHRQESAQKAKLEKHYRQRKTVLASLGKEISSKDQQLRQLLENEQQLQQLLQALNRDLGDILVAKEQQRPFAQLRGKLAWPTTGQVQKLFGKSRTAGNLRWNGILIDGHEGNTVFSVARGRVAYADWLRGYGLLLIIDHGDGYMSLYGHNQSLFKEVGDWVEADEAVASVGNSGGQAHSGLYFEIRQNGKPVNPADWCRTSRRS